MAVSGAWTEEPRTSLRPLKRNSEMKYQSRSLRLSNNNITELHDLLKPVRHFLAEPSLLAWLDLSFNKISHIDQVSSLLSVSYLLAEPSSLAQNKCVICMFLCCRFCASCVSCVCCIFTATAFLFYQRWTGWECCPICTPSLCMGMS